jgi:predicted phage baseplate assembly protein
MPIRPPRLDDRGFDDLVDELLARIPAHTPEWTNPRLGDPGRTMIELFAWLADTLLYRANLIPERQRLAFLRLLGAPMRPAAAARGLVSVGLDEEAPVTGVSLRPLAVLKGPATFETLSELTVYPIVAEGYFKRPLTDDERGSLAAVVQDLRRVYRLPGAATPYVTTPVFAGVAAAVPAFDVARDPVDRSLWLALLAPSSKCPLDAIRKALGEGAGGASALLSVGVIPAVAVPALFEEIGPRARVPVQWAISTGRNVGAEPQYIPLDVVSDSTGGMIRRGVVRLALPAAEHIGAPTNDVRTLLEAGVGDRPPRLDDPDRAARLVAWIRLRPADAVNSLALSWAGVNAVEIDQRQTVQGVVIGQGAGQANQDLALPARSVDPATFRLEVEESGRGFQPWQPIDDLATAGRDDAAYSLDGEAGTVRFGDGVRGRIPEAGARVRVVLMRAGGGSAGNLPPGALKEISATDLTGARVLRKLKVFQPVATDGGDDAETLDEAERRIPALLRHRDRAVTEQDYRRLAAETPGVRLGRVELLSRFKPHQRLRDVPGVVSVMVLPQQEARRPPTPRPDRPLLEAVHAHLDARRPLATELYVIGCEYVPVGIGVKVSVRDGFGPDAVSQAVQDALRLHLWPLSPGGPSGEGWPLGREVRDLELEVIVSRVAGVSAVPALKLFARSAGSWREVPRPSPARPAELRLEEWQLPELLSVVVITDAGEIPPDLEGVSGGAGAGADRPPAIAVPVVPEVCC